PFANTRLECGADEHISGGGGLADSYYQPFILGWEKKRAAFRAVYGFLAPTGSFRVGADDNLGAGYSPPALQMYEVPPTQEGTGIHPGQTFNLDYSLMRVLPFGDQPWLQVGLVGY